ncbi:hypothetical protein [Enterobacter ludwigii]
MQHHDVYLTMKNEIIPRRNNNNRDYFSDAKANRILPLQAMGMQPIRDFWKKPSKLGYDEKNSRKILEYRYHIKNNIENFSAENFVGLLKNYNRTHQAHIRAAAESGTASPSGSVMYHGGELLSGLTYFLCGGSIATFIFGHASKFFNNPIGEQSNKRRDALSNVLSGYGRVFAQNPNVRLRTAGSVSLILGQTMRKTNLAAEIKYKTLKKSNSLPVSLNKGSLLSEIQKNKQLFLTQRSISFPNYMYPFPVCESSETSSGTIQAVFYLSSDDRE